MYVNTYVLSVPEEKKDDYVRIANVFAELAKDFGALGEMPFDSKRMILGGFEPILTYRKAED